MKENIDNTLEFLKVLLERVIIGVLITEIAIISIGLLSLFDLDIIFKVVCINTLIGLMPGIIDLLLIVILSLIKCIIYD